MAKQPPKIGSAWTATEISQLRTLAAGNPPTRIIGLKLIRSEQAIYSKAAELGISLKPTNQSPYNRK
ncbi:hypothetical protein NB04_06685 [Pseudomonas syringae pv. tomato]|nr:hypothetical protein NB04_06685 [Pseudomonas syringae pv. tomato]TES63207.1 hypothetical protein E2N90_27905 [Pseudomonas syringae pv. tomato]TES74643.1 hypothetical protein E2N89_23540 [Pseudomonas syringae pv. tomato]